MILRNNTKFVLVGLGRCGSNLLKFGLRQNAQIFMAGEYFNKHSHPESLQQDGKARAQAFFEGSRRNSVRAVGFKIFLHHGRKHGVNTVWKYLRKNREIKILHLSRENTFKRLLSLEVANVRGQWLNDGLGTDDIVITHSNEWWQEKIESDLKKESALTKTFHKHDRLHISYENLIQDWDQLTTDIQSFVGAQATSVEKSLRKQEYMPLSQRCPNLAELQTFFQNSPYRWMFE